MPCLGFFINKMGLITVKCITELSIKWERIHKIFRTV